MHIAVVFGPDDAVELAELAVEHASVEEQEGVKGLVLSGGGHSIAHRQLREKATYLLRAELVRGSTVNKGLTFPTQRRYAARVFRE